MPKSSYLTERSRRKSNVCRRLKWVRQHLPCFGVITHALEWSVSSPSDGRHECSPHMPAGSWSIVRGTDHLYIPLYTLYLVFWSSDIFTYSKSDRPDNEDDEPCSNQKTKAQLRSSNCENPCKLGVSQLSKLVCEFISYFCVPLYLLMTRDNLTQSSSVPVILFRLATLSDDFHADMREKYD